MRHRSFHIALLVMISLFSVWGLPDPEVREAMGEENKVRLIAAGDVILHIPILHSARQESGVYDFRPIFEPIAPILRQGDLTVAVLETVLSGPQSGGYTGYPRFNSPDEVAEALHWSGVDLVFTAHNHSLDRGEHGVLRTQAVLRRIGMAYVGTNTGPDEDSRIHIQIVNGIRIAFLSYTLSTNGLPSPTGKAWLVHRFQREQVRKDIELAKKRGADAIVCALHAGTEYQIKPDAAQREAVRYLMAHGVDLVLGSHPHVVQPLEWRSRRGPEGMGTSLVAYSLGNFLSNQQWRYSDCGLVLDITLSRLPGKRLLVSSIAAIPVWVHRYRTNNRFSYRILPVPPRGEVVEDAFLGPQDRQRLRQVWEDTKNIIGEKALFGQLTALDSF